MLALFMSMEVKMYKEKIIDLQNGTETFRDYTLDEIKEVNKAIEETQKELEAQAQKAAAKQALLDKLGITAEEAQLLLGGN
jgi:hypothetical protein